MEHTLNVKVCGITHQSNLDSCMGMGAQFCGFIFHPKSARYISPRRAAGLRTAQMKRVGVFVHQQEDEINNIANVAKLDFIQLHGDQSISCARNVGVDRVIRVLWPKRYATLQALEEEMERYADSCAWFLLEAGIQGGGSGKTIDWSTLSQLKSPRPWFLAGGLSPETIKEALSTCRPDGIDINSGIEWAPGQKSVSALLSALRATDPYRQQLLHQQAI